MSIRAKTIAALHARLRLTPAQIDDIEQNWFQPRSSTVIPGLLAHIRHLEKEAAGRREATIGEGVNAG